MLLGDSWVLLGRSWGLLGAPGSSLGAAWGLLGRSLGIPGGSLDALGVFLWLLGGSLGPPGGSLGAPVGSWGALRRRDENRKSPKTNEQLEQIRKERSFFGRIFRNAINEWHLGVPGRNGELTGSLERILGPKSSPGTTF